MDVNKRIGDYEILEELGRGGMGRVYRVRNVISDRVEAMKVLLPDLVSRADLESRFLREIKTLAALNHPSIATLRTAMKNGDELVMIMEFVDGQSLSQRLKMGPIPVDEALTYIDQVLDALSYAHAQHVIHRDIKPANMMLSTDGLVKLTDFGIARSRNDVTLTAAGTTTGSLPYMSPEQVNAEPTDARSDLYSVGISLYEMVTGQRPFQADSDFAVMVAHLKEMPRPPIELQPALGPELNAVIMKAIAKSPADRYQSADDFRHALTTVPAFAATLTTPMAVAPAVAAPSQTPTIVNAPAYKTATTVPPLTSERIRTLMDAPATPSAPVPPVPPVPVVPQPVMRKPANAFVYMAIGGVVTVAALVYAGWYITSATASPTPATTTSTPATAPATTPAATAAAPATAPTTEPAATTAAAPSTAPATPASTDPATPTTPATLAPTTAAAPTTPATASTPPAAPAVPPASTPSVAPTSAAPANALAPSTPRPTPPQATAKPAAPARPPARETTPAPTASAPANRETPAAAPSQPMTPAFDFDALEEEIDQLASRAVAINRSLDNLQREQARQGLGLRGDIAARQQSMNTNLNRAEEAVAQRNVARAQRLKAQAEADVEALEKFLGR